MKVLLIDVNCKNSSTGQIVYDLYAYINSQGDEAAVCYGRGKKILEKGIFKFGIDFETYLHALLTRITGFTGCYSFFSTMRLINYIKNFEPDVVHIHELHAYFVNIRPLINYLKKNHIKTVMTLHCEFAYTGKCGHSFECEQWKSGCKNCTHLKEYIGTMFFDHTSYMWNQKKLLFEDYNELIIAAPSEWLANRGKESILRTHPVRVIHNGIDTSIFYPRNVTSIRKRYGISNEDKVFLALAPHLMSDAKGGKYIIELAEKFKNEKAVFILIGVDNVNNTERHNNLIINGSITDKDELALHYSLADAFIICSKRENFPTTCLEAQACGTPIYGFATGGTVETYLGTQPEKHFVDYGNIDVLYDLLLSVEKKTDTSVNELRGEALYYFSKDSCSREYYSLYSQMAEG